MQINENSTPVAESANIEKSEKIVQMSKLLYQNLQRQNLISKYVAPTWASSVIPAKHIPTERLNLSLKNTPINEWNLPGKPDNFNLYIKREDLNGSILGGNKIKKLEFSIAKAIKNNCNHIITTGTALSNHCRTTALACSQLGLKCTLLQTTDKVIF